MSRHSHHSVVRIFVFIMSAVVAAASVNAQAIRQDWHKNLTLFSPADQWSARTAVDKNGDVYWAVNNQDSVTALKYISLEKLDTFSNMKFYALYFGATGGELTDIKADADGNTYLYGINYGGSANGSNTTFLNKYDSAGTLAWSINFDFDLNGEEVPDQIYLSPLNGDIIVTASEYFPQQLLVARFTSDGDNVWQNSFGKYEAGDIVVDESDRIHLATTYHFFPGEDGQHFAYLLLNGNGSIVNGFTQTGGNYSHAVLSGGKGRTVGIDENGNFYCLAWVETFPFDSVTWTNIMVYKFDNDGFETWSKRLKPVITGYPGDTAVLLVDYTSGETSVIGGNGLWRYTTNGFFFGGSYSGNRSFVDAMMYNREKTFALSSGDPADGIDSGKITHYDWSSSDTSDAFYVHGRADIQFLNSTAIAEPDSTHGAMYVTWSYQGKVSLHRLVLRDTLNTFVNEISESENEIQIYPNPATDIFSVLFKANSNGPITLQVRELSGRVLIEKSFQHMKNIQLPIENLNAGIYAVIIAEGSNRSVKKLVVSSTRQ